MVNPINAGDTAWILVCCSLVLLMTPALALFYGGMVRRKNVLSTLTLSYIFMALIGVQWVLYGYSLAFGADIQGLIGGLNFVGFQRRRTRCPTGLQQNHPPRAFCRLSDDVRGHHAGADHRRLCGAGEIQELSPVQPALGDAGL